MAIDSIRAFERRFAILSAMLTAAPLLLVAPPSWAGHGDGDSCPDVEDNGGQSLVQFLYDESGNAIASGATIAIPRTPPPGEPPPRVDVHALAQAHGTCDIFFFNRVIWACDLGAHYERTLRKVVGYFSTPIDPSGSSTEFAINPDGTTAKVHLLDSSDDTATTPGPVTTFDSLTNNPGLYTHWSYSPINETPCDLYPDEVSSSLATSASPRCRRRRTRAASCRPGG